MTFGAFIWFGFNTIDLFKQISSHNPGIIFDKGSFYLPGVSVVLGSLLYNMIYEGMLKRELTPTIAKRITYSAFAGIGLIIILPQVAHYTVQDRLESNGYNVCEQASSQWLMYRKIAYTTNTETCMDMVEIKRIPHRQIDG